MKALLIYNPESRSGRSKKLLPLVTRALEEGGVELSSHRTCRRGDATKAASGAASEKMDAVIAFGGDGTINEIANGIAGTDTVLGILPAGTENVLSKELGIGLDIENALHVILEGRVMEMDLGLAHDRYFVAVAGIGFDAQVASEVSPFLKSLIGSAAYPLTAVKTLFSYEPGAISVTADDGSHEGHFVIVCNTRTYGMDLKMAPKAKIDDGLLDVRIFKGANALDMVRHGVEALIRRDGGMPGVDYLQSRRLIIDAKKSLLVHTDCEIIGRTPVKVECARGALKVLVPRG